MPAVKSDGKVVCAVVRDGKHCFDPEVSYSPRAVGFNYERIASGTAYGRVRLGWVPDEPPACNPGYLVREYGTYTWVPGANLTLVYPAAQPSTWSSAFEDVDQSDGRVIGIRTMACAFG